MNSCMKIIVLVDFENSESRPNFGYHRGIKFQEIIRKMRRQRAIGTYKISVEFWKSTSKAGIDQLIGWFNIIFRTTKNARGMDVEYNVSGLQEYD